MQKLYVNEIGPDSEVSTVGLFYSEAEAQKIVEMLQRIPERAGFRYEIVEAARHVLSEANIRRPRHPSREIKPFRKGS